MKILIPLAFILTLFATNVNALQKDGVFFVITGHYENTDIVKSAAILKFATMSECQAATYEFFDDLEKTDGKLSKPIRLHS